MENPVVLAPLTPELSRTLALELINASSLVGLSGHQKDAIAEHLSRLGDRYPIWIAMAVNVLEKHGDLSSLPFDANDIASKYLEEVIDRSTTRTCSHQQLLQVLRWLAIYEEVDVEDGPLVKFVSSQAGLADVTGLLECLNSLVSRKFVVRRGVNQRLYSIKPDVMRDHVVRNWLIWSAGGGTEPTAEARKLVTLIIAGHDNKPVPRVYALIRGLAKAEYATSLQGTKLDFLSPLVSEIRRLAQEGTVLEQQGIIGFLSSFDFARLTDVLEIIRTIRLAATAPAEVKDILGETHVVEHQDVVAQLAWPLFNAARYARSEAERVAVLEEMAVLSMFETNIPDLYRNDGKRADGLVPRMISGENDWYAGFSETAFAMAERLVARLRTPDGMDEPTLNWTKVLCNPFLSVERERTHHRQHAITISRWSIALDSPEGVRRDTIRKGLRECICAATASEACRLLSWRLLSHAHSSANRALVGERKEVPESYVLQIKNDLKADLEWTLSALRARSLPFRELKAARRNWDWHSRFEKDAEIKAVADQCESLYQQHPLVATFHVFFSHEMYEQVPQKAKEVGEKLGGSGTSQEITRFLKQAEEFPPDRSDWFNVMQVVDHVAPHWETNKELPVFVSEALARAPGGIDFAFAACLLNRRLRTLRASNAVAALKSELGRGIQAASTPDAKAALLSMLYGNPHPVLTGILTVTDLEFVTSEMAAIPGALKAWTKCQYLANMYYTDWQRVRQLCEQTFRGAPAAEKLTCFLAILQALHFVDHTAVKVNAAQHDWLLTLMLSLPDLDGVNDNCQWDLDQLIDRFGRKDVIWLLSAIQSRIREADGLGGGDGGDYKIVPTRHRLTRYVAPLPASGVVPSAVREAINALLNYTERKDMLGYILPAYAADVDPHGVLVPELLVARIQSAKTDKEVIWVWARFAGYYGFNSQPWKSIAGAAVTAARGLPPRDQTSVYVTLLPQEIKSSNYPAGEMDPRPEQDLQRRKRELQDETDEVLLPFRKWHLAAAQGEYDQALARYKEENEP